MRWWIIPTIIVGLLILRIIIRGYFWKTKSKEKLSFKEFMKRWKGGIEGITPLQATKTQLMGIWITISGIIAGIIINCLVRIQYQWIWITVILSGSFILVIINFISTLQKYWKFKKIEEEIKKLNEQGGNNDEEIQMCSNMP